MSLALRRIREFDRASPTAVLLHMLELRVRRDALVAFGLTGRSMEEGGLVKAGSEGSSFCMSNLFCSSPIQEIKK